MKEARMSRSGRERKAQLSPDAERLVASALGLANSGSRLEDAYWQQMLAKRLEHLLDTNHPQAIYDALDRTHLTDLEAYGALIEMVEHCAETVIVEYEGQPWQCLLVSAPLVAWTRFGITSGRLPAAHATALGAHWQAHCLANPVRFCMVPWLYSIDQLPRDFSELRKLTRRLGTAALKGQDPRLDFSAFPETAEMLADSRFILAGVAAPLGQPLLRWQDLEADDHATRVQCLEQWVAQGRPNLEPVMVGCGFECLLPDAFHINLRESDRRVRPYALRAAVHYLTHALSIEAKQLRANIAAFGQDRLDEYRVGLSFDSDEEVSQGVVWPMLGAESEGDDPSPLDQIRQHLRELGVNDIRVHAGCSEPEFCDDCGSPLYPNSEGEVVHAEMPEDSEPNPGHFH
ncbi:MAG: DUF2863 family protein [Betaproteobacteria bacterium]|nr:DUF2863 family protein [Betaproteobacteria bacterium]NBP10917.1 DUF2863 family protein [Betaproteobacteria bacterium]NBP61705.1 DUF2863 family protein [Betaproteobacteria bacterium]NBT65416.1 DUF2863 family protein [Betaproteobacteria bacterium]NBU02018.1 DUF2863 family protein [Betaproteobacteria bacterium]